MANGDVVRTASRARKSAAGYDLTRLMVGSEGTLGIITEVTLKLQKIPEASAVAMCSFPTVKHAADVAIAIMHSGIQVRKQCPLCVSSRPSLFEQRLGRQTKHSEGRQREGTSQMAPEGLNPLSTTTRFPIIMLVG